MTVPFGYFCSEMYQMIIDLNGERARREAAQRELEGNGRQKRLNDAAALVHQARGLVGGQDVRKLNSAFDRKDGKGPWGR